MRNGKGLASLAACVALACGGIVRAADAPATVTASTDSSDLSLTPLYLDATTVPVVAPPPRKPLMDLLDKAGLAKPLDDAGINIFGWIEGSYTYDASNPPGNIITGRVFDFENEEVVLNQWDLVFERVVDVTQKKFDIGFRVEWMYGSDARIIHSNGLDFYGPGYAGNGGQLHPQNQFDLTQAYVDLAVPVGNGLRVRMGKFVTLLGYETINPTTNALYSHSYLFGFAIPFTNTGIYGTYAFSDQWSVDVGLTRGWDQSTVDNNDVPDYIGRVTYTCPDKKTVVYFTNITGCEQNNNNSDYTSVFDLIVTYAATDALTLAVNGDFGFASDGAPDGSNAQWYGIAGYAGYKLNDMFTINGRGEWFADPQGARGLNTDGVYEATLGVTITPFHADAWGSNLKFRPELRYDYSQQQIFDGGSQNYQFTAAIEAYFTY